MRALTVCAVLVIMCPLTAEAATQVEVPIGYRHVAAEVGVPPGILYAVALTESGKAVDAAGSIRPWPWTLNILGQGHFYDTRQAATDALTQLITVDGKPSVDVGLMQINWRYHGGQLESPSRALDPYINLCLAARILKACFRRGQDWWQAVGCYHAPNHSGHAARYRARVFVHWRHLAERGAEK